MATAHLIHGFLGSGKTTLARTLEHDCPAVRFTPDEWMARLFGDDPPAPLFQEKAAAILAAMEPVWTRCLSLGLDVVLDFGFWRRDERDRTRAVVRGLGAEAVLHALECPEAEAWRRIAARNTAAHRSLYIAPATFQLLRARFEALGEDEPRVRP